MTLLDARSLRNHPSRAERALWKVLRNRALAGFKFRRQHPIDRYFADFACVNVKLVIEVDGPSHGLPDQLLHDRARTKRLSELGWRILRLSNDEVIADESRTIAKILASLEATPSP